MIFAAFVLLLEKSWRHLITNSGKRFMVAITIIICAAVAGMVAHRVGGVDAASQHVAAPHGGIGTAAVATKP